VIGFVVAPLIPILGLVFLLAAERLEQGRYFTGPTTASPLDGDHRGRGAAKPSQ
jgi:hypothetical protein